MQPAEVMEALLEIAEAAEIEVRSTRAGAPADADWFTASGVCRVEGRVWVVLSESDPVDIQLDVLASALREHAAEQLEQRFLPPAVRERLGT